MEFTFYDHVCKYYMRCEGIPILRTIIIMMFLAGIGYFIKRFVLERDIEKRILFVIWMFVLVIICIRVIIYLPDFF